MKAYLIRAQGDNSGDIVGSAVVSSTKDLWLTIDEFANPHDFEYLRVRGTCILCNVGLGWSVNETAREQMPFTDSDLEAFGEDDESQRGVWQTMIELCGGQGKFDKMYREMYLRHQDSGA